MTTNQDVILKSDIKCPECGYRKIETMPTDSCLWFYECEECHTLLKPLQGDCCVFCSYGSIPCPPIQISKGNNENSCCSN
ncbi:GDCCVxC domain-containing (seleno)protein [Nitrosomonas aestuarii]|uniref:GDCCVxC domain-containing (seleno)protein n=1 Tax=Nitrosomonas aestuarii TaxID=52441 RepID=UPI000D30DDEA|nr:GDCCVxC domain-containing (seleno)protein [Nitrosomonas aestuarii]